MKTRIEEAANEHVNKQYDNETDKSWSRLDFIAGAEFMQGEFDNEETLRTHMNRIGYNKLKELEAQNKIMRVALDKIDSSNDDMKYFNSDIHVIIQEALKKVGEG
jgi:hypothetical protein